MGMYDTVWVKCPHCGKRTDMQSKSGDCCLDNYELKDAPIEVVADLISGRGWTKCTWCSKNIKIELVNRPVYRATTGEEGG